MRFTLLLLVLLTCFCLAKAEEKPQGLVTLSEKLSKQSIKPFTLTQNEEFSLYNHPFNSEVYWVVKDFYLIRR